MKVFVGGSRQLGRLNSEIRRRLDNIMANAFTILVGDANGIDKAVQKYCVDKHYKRVMVFCAGDSCRNNLGNWEIRHVAVDRVTKNYKFFMAKDLEMAREADYGFMIWDGQSSGTLSNILELLETDKRVLVYMGPQKDFIKLQSTADLASIIQNCPAESINIFESKLKLSSRLQAKQPKQLPLFS